MAHKVSRAVRKHIIDLGVAILDYAENREPIMIPSLVEYYGYLAAACGIEREEVERALDEMNNSALSEE